MKFLVNGRLCRRSRRITVERHICPQYSDMGIHMKYLIRKSFKRKQLVCFLAVALLPLLATSVFLTAIVKSKVESDYEKEVESQAEKADAALIRIFDSLRETAELICENKKIIGLIDETDSWERGRAYTEFYNETMAMRQYAQFDIYNRAGECVYSTGSRAGKQTLPTYWGILRAAEQTPQELVFLREDAGDDGEEALLYGAKYIADEDGASLGYVVVSMRGEHFAEILRGVFGSQEGIAILDAHWQTVYSAGTAEKERIGAVFRQRLLHGEKLPAVYDSNGVYVSPVGETGMYKILLCPEVFSTDVVKTMYTVILLMAGVCFALCILVAERLSSSLTFPIRRMNDAMHRLQEGRLDTRIPVDRKDEFGQMSENFNIMANKLEDYMEQQVKAQQELNASHIAMMQAQMNPHFLYNTLDTMKWLAKANHIPEIATMSAGLARILRTSISSEQFIRLKEELDFVKSYVEIQKIRYSDRFRYEISVPQPLEACIVPKLVVQPIVENAIIHGLEECEDGLIQVTVSEREETYYKEETVCREKRLFIEVKDNGCGIPEEIMECLNSKDRDALAGHIGFYNVDTIIRLHYGEQYGLHVSRPEEGGTCVEITLPVKM